MSSVNLLLLNHHLIKEKNLVSFNRLHCRELYNTLVYTSPHKPTSQVHFENLFLWGRVKLEENLHTSWKAFLDCNVSSFQYKVLNNVLYLNKKLTKELCNRLDLFFNNWFHLPQLLPQTAFFEFSNTYSNKLIIPQNKKLH